MQYTFGEVILLTIFMYGLSAIISFFVAFLIKMMDLGLRFKKR